MSCVSRFESPIARRPIIVTVLFALGSTFSSAAENRDSGKLRGLITIQGDVPQPAIIGRSKEGVAVLDESLEVDPKTSGVANVVVYLAKPPPGVDVPVAPVDPVIASIAGGRFVPHVLGVRAGQPVALTNGDPAPQTFHGHPLRNQGINMLMAPAGAARFSYDKSERLPVMGTSDLSPWMRTYHVVLDHPWFAVTDAEGKFGIDGLPPGKHEFVIWHERAGCLERKFAAAIVAGEVTQITEAYPVDKFEAVLRVNADVNRPDWIGPFDLSSPGDGRDAALGRRMLLSLFQKKIEAVDRICGLSAEQKRKLEVAGNGDIERLLDRIDEVRVEFASVRNTPDKMNDFLVGEVRPIRRAFETGPFDAGSLFAKVLRTTLTSDQTSIYERDRRKSPARKSGAPPATSAPR